MAMKGKATCTRAGRAAREDRAGLLRADPDDDTPVASSESHTNEDGAAARPADSIVLVNLEDGPGERVYQASEAAEGIAAGGRVAGGGPTALELADSALASAIEVGACEPVKDEAGGSAQVREDVDRLLEREKYRLRSQEID